MDSQFDEFEEIDNDADEISSETQQPRAKKKNKTIKRLVVGILLFLLVILVIYIAYISYLKTKYNKMIPGQKAGIIEDVRNLLNPSQLKGQNTGDVNILFIGMRNKDMVNAYDSSAMMVVNLDTKNDKINLFSIPRDLWIPIDGNFGKANTVYKTALSNSNKYANSGLPFTKKTYSDVLGVNINYIFTCDFDSFEKIINRIGKININISADEAQKYPFLSYEQFASARDSNDPTLYHFDGPQSFIFVSWPKDAVPDFDRLRRMQLFLFSFTKQYINTEILLHPMRVNDVLNIADDGIKTDIQIWEAKKIINISEQVPLGNISQHKLTTNTSADGGLLRQINNSNITYSPIAGDSDFSQIHAWAKNIINR